MLSAIVVYLKNMSTFSSTEGGSPTKRKAVQLVPAEVRVDILRNRKYEMYYFPVSFDIMVDEWNE